jgi:tetratricopeptide (TPR) repeat protein
MNVSWLYSELEDGENALEWAKMGSAQPHFLSTEGNLKAMVLTRLARAFTLLGKLEQAEKYLEESETQALMIGSDAAISDNHIVAGHIEIAKGNLEAALYHFERGLEIAEHINYQNRINSCLIGLVRIEIAMLETDESISLRETSGPWMKLLQSEVNKKDLPGIRGRLLLLKTELRLKQERFEEANGLLDEIRSMTKEPGLHYLGQKASELQLKIELKSRR